MTITRGSTLSRRLALALLALIVLVILIAAAIPFAARWTEFGRAIVDRRTEIAAMETRRAAEAEIAGAAGQWAAYAADPRSGFAPEASAVLAAEAGIRRMKALFGALGGTWDRGGLVEVQREGPVERVRFAAAGALPEPRLNAFLTAIEAEPPFVFIDAFDVRVTARPQEAPASLSVKLEAEIWRMRDPKP